MSSFAVSSAPASGAPLVTIGVFAHNHERFVAECLESVLAAGPPGFQLLIFDDGSDDGTDAVIRAWIESHSEVDATYCRHEKPLGIGRTLNEAIASARGGYVTGLAADDVLLPNGIEERIAYLERHPEKLAVFSDAAAIDASGKRLFESAIEGHYSRFGMKKTSLTDDSLLPYELVFHWGVPGPVFLCRRHAYDVVGHYDESLLTEDWDMYLRLAAVGRLGFHDAVVGSYRLLPDSITHRAHDRVLADTARAARQLAPVFRGALSWRLRAIHDLWVARNSPSLARRAFFWVRARTGYALALTGYRLTSWRARRRKRRAAG